MGSRFGGVSFGQDPQAKFVGDSQCPVPLIFETLVSDRVECLVRSAHADSAHQARSVSHYLRCVRLTVQLDWTWHKLNRRYMVHDYFVCIYAFRRDYNHESPPSHSASIPEKRRRYA